MDCKNCDVVIVGGGDTGSDCVGIARRQGAKEIFQLDLTGCPPTKEDKEKTWPEWPRKLRTSSSHEEGCQRLWNTATREILRDDKGQVRAVRCVKLQWQMHNGRSRPVEVPGSEFEIAAQKVFLAMGFVHLSSSVAQAFEVQQDARGNVLASAEDGPSAFASSCARVFSCGDARSGQSLVVRAISEGRRCARAVDIFLTGRSSLP